MLMDTSTVFFILRITNMTTFLSVSASPFLKSSSPFFLISGPPHLNFSPYVRIYNIFIEIWNN